MLRCDVRAGLILCLLLAGACKPSQPPPPPPPGQTTPEPEDPTAEQPEPGVCQIDVAETSLRRLTPAQYRNVLQAATGVDPSDLTPLPTAVAAAISELEVETLGKNAAAVVEQGGHRAHLTCTPTGPDDEACLLSFIRAFGQALFRRPVTADEESALLDTWHRARATEELTPMTFDDGVDLVAQVLLQSPQLVYRVVEGTPDEAAPPGLRRTTGYERAELLAFFLTDGPPDEALLAAAKAGALDTDEGLRTHAERLLQTPGARQMVRRFASGWLGLDATARVTALEDRPKSKEKFPLDSPGLRHGMRTEVEALYEWVVFDADARFRTLMTTRWTHVNPPLALLYGLGEIPGGDDDFVDTWLHPSQRAGLFTRAAFLAQWAGAEHTSPIRRGVEIFRNVLCLPLPDPPSNVNNIPPEPSGEGELLTTRKAVEKATAPPACVGCHAQVNPLGFALEHYDALGAWRTTESVPTPEGPVDVPIDAAAPLRAGDLGDSVNGGVDLSGKLAKSLLAHDCHAQRWFERLTGHSPTPADMCALRPIQQRFRETDDIRALLIDLATGPHVKWVRPQPEGEVP